MEDRKRKEFKLTEKDIDYINRIAEKYKIKTSEALTKIISEHIDPDEELNRETNETKLLKKLLLTVNNINKLSEVNLEVLNSICLKNNYTEDDFVAKKRFTTDIMYKAYEEVENNITEANIKKNS